MGMYDGLLHDELALRNHYSHHDAHGDDGRPVPLWVELAALTLFVATGVLWGVRSRSRRGDIQD